MTLFCIGLDIMSIIMTLILLIGVLIGKKNVMNKYFRVMLLFQTLILFSDVVTLTFLGEKNYRILVLVFVIARGSFMMLSLAMFALYVDHVVHVRKKTNRLCRVLPICLTTLGMLLWIASFWFEWFYSLTPENEFQYGKYYFVFVLLGGAIVIFEFIRIMIHHIKEVLANDVAVCLYLFILLPTAAFVAAKMTEAMSLFYATMTMSYMVVYVAIRIHEKPVEPKPEVQEEVVNLTELTLSQLQPHFLVNSMTNIKYLVKKDPDLAEEAIEEFTRYLCKSIEAIEDQSLIPFSEELEHTKSYLWLEQLRFKNLKVEYHIEVDSFYVPTLSLQPIVENAVKHGVCKKIGGGKISITTREFADYYKVIVKDDGVGFEVKDGKAPESESCAIQEIRTRLYQMNQSKIHIASTKDVGTTVTFKIMKEDIERERKES